MTDEVEPNTEETPQEEQPKVYSQTEVDTLLKSQYDKLNVTLSKQGAELKRLRERPPDTDDTLLQTLIADRKRNSDGENDPVIQQLEAQISQRKQTRQLEAQRQTIENKRDEYKDKLRDAGIDVTDDDLLADLHTALDDELWVGDGNFTRAERQFNKLMKTVPKKEKEVENKETEEQMKERIIREYLEKQGSLKQEQTKPSGGGRTFTAKQIEDMSPKEYMENREEILAAQQEGRIKQE